jgi:maltooligosyltrehalose trehalohydrolase
VQEGRRREFEAFASSESFLDPQDEQTFLRSKLHWEKRNSGRHGVLLNLYRRILELRRTTSALRDLNLESVETWNDKDLLCVRRFHHESGALIAMNFGSAQTSWTCPVQGTTWVKALNTAAPEWAGPVETAPEKLAGGGVLQLSPTSLVLFIT